nr:Chain C, peptide from HLA-DPA1 protein [synthetic construct]
EEAGRAFSF